MGTIQQHALNDGQTAIRQNSTESRDSGAPQCSASDEHSQSGLKDDVSGGRLLCDHTATTSKEQKVEASI